MEQPTDPIAAATHPDPYPYYARLVAQRPFYRDETIGMLVASSAGAVAATLHSPLCRVRPPGEPIPPQLLGTPVAEIFRHLVRMSDGAAHCPFKRAVATTLAALDPRVIAAQGDRWARTLVGKRRGADTPSSLTDVALRLPIYAVASVLGVPADTLPTLAGWVAAYVACLVPGGDLARGSAAAAACLATFRALLAAQERGRGDGVLAALAREAGGAGMDVIVANGIGLLTQTYEATAGLIGNTLVALASRPEWRPQATDDPALLAAIVREVLRHDPPIQNTRRFVARDGEIAGEAVRAGDAILVVLAAANRDPAANPQPARFDPGRQDARTFALGAGAHACPGEDLAIPIATAGVARLLASGRAPDRLGGPVAYRPSPNARLPLL